MDFKNIVKTSLIIFMLFTLQDVTCEAPLECKVFELTSSRHQIPRCVGKCSIYGKKDQ